MTDSSVEEMKAVRRPDAGDIDALIGEVVPPGIVVSGTAIDQLRPLLVELIQLRALSAARLTIIKSAFAQIDRWIGVADAAVAKLERSGDGR